MFRGVHQAIANLTRHSDRESISPDMLDYSITLIADSRKEVIWVSLATLWGVNQTLRMAHQRPLCYCRDGCHNLIYFDGCLIIRPKFLQIWTFQGECFILIRVSLRLLKAWYCRRPIIITLVTYMEIQLVAKRH